MKDSSVEPLPDAAVAEDPAEIAAGKLYEMRDPKIGGSDSSPLSTRSTYEAPDHF